VRAGDAKPESVASKHSGAQLLAAKSIAYSDSGSGTYLSTTLFAKLGNRRANRRQEPKGAGTSVRRAGGPGCCAWRGEIGFQQVSELIQVPGITFVGPLPTEVQPAFSFAGSLTSSVQQPRQRSALIRFLASSEAAPAISKAGLMPVSENRNLCNRFGSAA